MLLNLTNFTYQDMSNVFRDKLILISVCLNARRRLLCLLQDKLIPIELKMTLEESLRLTQDDITQLSNELDRFCHIMTPVTLLRARNNNFSRAAFSHWG